MAIVSLTSAKGAPGVTTSALALALAWPRPCLLLEADMAGSSSILAGYFQGDTRQDRGLIDLAEASRRGDLTEGLHAASIPLENSQARFIPGLRATSQSATMLRLWEPIAAVLRSLGDAGTDVIVDAGRVSTVASPKPLLRESDLTLLVLRSDMPSIAGARALIGGMRDDLTARGAGPDAVSALMVGEGRPYPRSQTASLLRIVMPFSIAWDPKNAEVLTYGTKPEKRWQSSRFVRSTHTCASQVDQFIQSRNALLTPDAGRTQGANAR